MDELIDCEEVNFGLVKSAFDSENENRKGSNEWASGCLETANSVLGKWIRAKVTFRTLSNIVLPYHDHKYSLLEKGLKLVPKEGSTVEEAYHKYLSNKEYYEENCPNCFQTIQYLRILYSQKKFGSIFLSQRPLHEYDMIYRWLTNTEGHFVHLDGLHRLIVLMEFSKMDEHYDNCYIAFERQPMIRNEES